MIGYIKDKHTFENIYMLEIESYEYSLNSIYTNLSTFTVIKEYSELEGNFLLYDEFIGIISSCEPSDGRTTIKCERIQSLFSRDLILDTAENTIEEYIAKVVNNEFIHLNDDVYSTPFLQVEYSTATKYSKPVNENGIYDIEHYLSRIRRLFNVFSDFIVDNNTLILKLERRTPNIHNIDFNMSDFQLKEEKYSNTEVGKVTTYNEGVQTDYYYFTDGTYSTDPTAGTRAEGEWVIMETDNIEDVADEFAKNGSSHSIQFYSSRKIDFYDRVIIRSNGRVVTSYIAQIIKSSTDDRYLYKTGDVITTASTYIKELKTQLEQVSNKVAYNTVTQSKLDNELTNYVSKTDIINVANGGTGLSTLTAGSYFVGNGDSVVLKTANEVKSNIGALGEPVLVWTNSSPSSAFGAQTITLSEGISGYSFMYLLCLQYRNSIASGALIGYMLSLSEFKVATSNGYVLHVFDTSAKEHYRYAKYNSDTKVTFTVCNVTGSSSADNLWIVPAEIYLI